MQTTRGLVFGAFMAALTVIMMLLPLPFYLPLPVALATLRHGPRTGALTGTVAALVAALFFGWLPVLITLVPLAVGPGLALGLCLRAGKPPSATGAWTALVGLGGTLFTFALSWLIAGRNPVEDLMLLVQSGAGSVLTRNMEAAQVEEFYRVLRLVIPAGILLSVGLSAILTYQFAAWVFPRLGHAIAPLPPLAHWTLPSWVMGLYLVGWALTIYVQGGFGGQPDLGAAAGPLEMLGTSLYTAAMGLFTLQGIALVSWLLQTRLQWPAGRSSVVACLIPFLVPAAMVLVSLAGLVDLMMDFRRLRT